MNSKNSVRIFDISLFLALKNILKEKKMVFLTLLIISLGFISSIIIYGVLQDVGLNLEQNFIDVNFGHVMLEPLENREKIEDVRTIMQKVRSLPEVEGAVAIQTRVAKFYDGAGDSLAGQIFIVNPEDFASSTIVEDLLFEGDYLNEKDSGVIFLGCSNLKSCSATEELATIDVDVGNSVLIKFGGGEEENLVLKGVYKHNFEQVDHLMLTNERTAEDIFLDFDPNQADMIIIRLSNRELTQSVIEELAFLGINAKILSWHDKATSFSSTVDSFEIIGDLSFLIGVIVAIISVYIILYINTLTKQVQIGIMRAIGIDTRIITGSYVLQALFFGIFGSIFGVILTLLMIGYFKINPIITTIGPLVPLASKKIFLMVGITITLASCVAGYLVSRKIIKQNILDLVLK